jgi:predicted SAM-dependent methyltransferase
MTEVGFADASFDAVVSLFAIIHIPLDEQRALFERLTRWLRPGGWLLATVGDRAWTGIEEDWLGGGAPMYWSHGGAETYLASLRELGFTIDGTSFIPEGDGGHTLVRARSRGEARRTKVATP